MFARIRIQRLVIGLFATVVVMLGLPAATHLVGSVAAFDISERVKEVSITAKPSMHSIANLQPSPRLRSALEGLETTDYRTVMMMCED